MIRLILIDPEEPIECKPKLIDLLAAQRYMDILVNFNSVLEK